jgi:hypothetical protein
MEHATDATLRLQQPFAAAHRPVSVASVVKMSGGGATSNSSALESRAFERTLDGNIKPAE